MKIPRRPFLEGDAGGLGVGKGTSEGSWKLERLGCWLNTVERTDGGLRPSSRSVSSTGVSGRFRALLIFDHIVGSRVSLLGVMRG